MPILDGFGATARIREIERQVSPSVTGTPIRVSLANNGRIPIFAVSASLREQQREEMEDLGMDGWILKPIDFKRMNTLLQGITDPTQRQLNVYRPGYSWEVGGWLSDSKVSPP